MQGIGHPRIRNFRLCRIHGCDRAEEELGMKEFFGVSVGQRGTPAQTVTEREFRILWSWSSKC